PCILSAANLLLGVAVETALFEVQTRDATLCLTERPGDDSRLLQIARPQLVADPGVGEPVRLIHLNHFAVDGAVKPGRIPELKRMPDDRLEVVRLEQH